MVSKFVKTIITLILMLITVDRRGKLTLGSILRFVTGTEKEPLLGFKLHPSLFSIKIEEKNCLPSGNICISRLNFLRATSEYNLPDEKTSFICLYFCRPILWSAVNFYELLAIIVVNRM